MDQFNRKQHWENIYQTKQPDEVSWFQPIPSTPLDFVRRITVQIFFIYVMYLFGLRHYVFLPAFKLIPYLVS